MSRKLPQNVKRSKEGPPIPSSVPEAISLNVTAAPIEKQAFPAGHNCALGCAAQAFCPLKKLIDKGLGNQVQEIQTELNKRDAGFMFKPLAQKLDAIAEKVERKVKRTIPVFTIKQEAKEIRRPETVQQPKVDKVESRPVIRQTAIKIPKPAVKTEESVKTMVPERAARVESNTPRELPRNIIERFWKKPVLTESSRAKQSEPTRERHAALPKKESEKPAIRRTVTRVFDRVTHQQRTREMNVKQPVTSEVKNRLEKIDFLKPLRLGILRLLPLSKVDKKFKPRLFSFSRWIRSFRGTTEIRTEKTAKKFDKKEPKQPKMIRTARIRSRFRAIEPASPAPSMVVLVEKIRRVILQEKQIPFAFIVFPSRKEKPEQQDFHEVMPVSEKVFLKLVSIASRISQTINSISDKEVKILNRLTASNIEYILSPVPEEIKNTLRNQANNIRGVLWYIAQTLLSLNRLNVYLTS